MILNNPKMTVRSAPNLSLPTGPSPVLTPTLIFVILVVSTGAVFSLVIMAVHTIPHIQKFRERRRQQVTPPSVVLHSSLDGRYGARNITGPVDGSYIQFNAPHPSDPPSAYERFGLAPSPARVNIIPAHDKVKNFKHVLQQSPFTSRNKEPVRLTHEDAARALGFYMGEYGPESPRRPGDATAPFCYQPNITRTMPKGKSVLPSILEIVPMESYNPKISTVRTVPTAPRKPEREVGSPPQLWILPSRAYSPEASGSGTSSSSNSSQLKRTLSAKTSSSNDTSPTSLQQSRMTSTNTTSSHNNSPTSVHGSHPSSNEPSPTLSQLKPNPSPTSTTSQSSSPSGSNYNAFNRLSGGVGPGLPSLPRRSLTFSHSPTGSASGSRIRDLTLKPGESEQELSSGEITGPLVLVRSRYEEEEADEARRKKGILASEVVVPGSMVIIEPAVEEDGGVF